MPRRTQKHQQPFDFDYNSYSLGDLRLHFIVLNETFLWCITHNHDANDKVRRRSHLFRWLHWPLAEWNTANVRPMPHEYSQLGRCEWQLKFFTRIATKDPTYQLIALQNHYYSSKYSLVHPRFCPFSHMHGRRRRKYFSHSNQCDEVDKQFSGILYLSTWHIYILVYECLVLVYSDSLLLLLYTYQQIVLNSHVAINIAYLFIAGINWINSLAQSAQCSWQRINAEFSAALDVQVCKTNSRLTYLRDFRVAHAQASHSILHR